MITLHDTVLDMIVKLSEGNPGAAIVCTKILKADLERGVMDLLHLDEMGMKGPAIWVGYKDYAGEDLNLFIKAVRQRAPDMIKMIRQQGYEAWEGGRS